MNKHLKNWEQATEELCEHFIGKYFGDPTDIYWVAYDIGGVLTVNDYFFDLKDIVDFIKYNYSDEDMFEYYDYAIERGMKNKVITNIKNWKKLTNPNQ